MAINGDPHPNQGVSSGMTPETVVNEVSNLLSRLELRVLASQQGLRDEIGRQGDIRRSQFNELRAFTDTRHDAVVEELKQVLAVSEEAVRGLGKLQAKLHALDQRHSDQIAHAMELIEESQFDRQKIHDEITELRRQFELYVGLNRRAEYEQRLRRLETSSNANVE